MNCNDNVRHIKRKRKFTKQETKLGRDIVARKRLVKREATLTVMILKDLNFHFFKSSYPGVWKTRFDWLQYFRTNQIH